MRKVSLFVRSIALILILCIAVCSRGINVLAAEEGEKSLDSLYLSDVKIFYAENEEQARKVCEAEGYIFSSQNLTEGAAYTYISDMQNIYEGPRKLGINSYFGYKTTDDPDKAITDLSLLDMKNSFFEEMTYKEFLDKYVSDFADQAAQIMQLVAEMRRQYTAGSPYAMMAYDSLNMFYVDDERSHTGESNLLGYYILNEADVSFFEKFIQRGNAQILSSIVNTLCLAASDYNAENTTWADRAKTSSISDLYANANSAEKNQYDTWYKQSAISFIRLLNNFASTYNEAMQKRETYGDAFGYEDLNMDSTMEDLLAADPNCKVPEYVNAILVYNMLDGIIYQEAGETVTTDTAILNEGEEGAEAAALATTTFTEKKTLAEYFLELAADPDLAQYPEKVYPFIEAMTSPQRTAMELCGLGNLVKGLYSAADYSGKRDSSIAEAEARIREAGFEDGKIYIWEGVDSSIYNLKTVETSDAIETERAGTAIIDSINAEARKNASTLTIALRITDISMMAVSGLVMVTKAIVGVGLYEISSACFFMSSLALASGLTGTGILYTIGGILAGCLWVLNIVMLVVSVAYMVYMIMDACGVFDPVERADYSTIPNIVFHVKQNSSGTYRVRYDAVPSNASSEYFTEILRRSTALADYEIRTASQVFSYMRSDVSDFGAFMQFNDRWMSPFVSKSPAAGNPIRINSEGTFFKLLGDSNAPAGYKPVTLVSNSQAADVHSINFGSDIILKPAYLFVYTGIPDSSAPEDTDRTPEKETTPETPVEPETKEKETTEEEKETPEEDKPSDKDNEKDEDKEKETDKKEANTAEAPAGSYITRVRLSHAKTREDAMNRLKSNGYLDIIDVNLTPYDGYTFLGFQYGSANAITDLRVSTTGASSILYGDASYSMAGDAGTAITPDGMAIYSTTVKSAGTPITKVAVVSKRIEPGTGAEPVCLFSGGNAVDFKHKWSDNMGLNISSYAILSQREHKFTNQDDLEDGYYIYFWPKEQYKASSEEEQAPYIGGFSYFLSADTGNEEFMQNYAKANGFELVTDGNGPATMMSDGPAKMNPIASWNDVEGGAMGHDWRYDIYHFLYGGASFVFSDGAVNNFDASIGKAYDNEDFYTTMYFGVSYTYNPYRAITGVAGLITPYTETTSSIRYSGLTTPAGTMLACNVSIQGNPTTGPGIAYGYFSYSNMANSLYVNKHTTQHSDLPWLSGGDTEVLSRYLLTGGPTNGREPLKRGDILFSTSAEPQTPVGYTPICDLRTPGDMEHPMNFALDTVDFGSKYLYLYLKNDAGGRKDARSSTQNVYQKKQYVAAVVVGSGKTPEQAIVNLYKRMSSMWPGLATQFPDISETPLITEFDEILPIDIDDETPWYEEYVRDTEHVDPKDDEWVYGNDAANRRWGHDQVGKHAVSDYLVSDKTADMAEHTDDCAYIGVIRTGYSAQKVETSTTDDKGKTTKKTTMVYPAYALLKYYTNDNGPEALHVGSVNCQLAGGPVNSREGRYYLYYSTNSATASFSAPITEIDVSTDAFINGFNTTYSCSDSDRVNYNLPEFSKLRMRTDEQLYIHTKYTMEDLPYIESVYIGVGKTQEEAYADLIGTTNANAATGVNCNYNSFSDTYIAIGYRRTAQVKYAIKDMFLYAGSDPQDKINISGYKITTTNDQGNTVQSFNEVKIPYYLVKHNLPTGSEVISLNEGNEGDPGLYLYYTTTSNKIAYEQSADKQLLPIRNMIFSYGDVSPEFVSAEQLAAIYAPTLHGQKTFDILKYSTPVWEYVMGVEGDTPEDYKLDGSASFPMDLNYGIYPTNTGSFHTGDHRVTMYVDRGNSDIAPDAAQYQPRKNAALYGAGYYSPSSNYGIIKQLKE